MVPKDLLFTSEHEWVRVEGDTGTVGISEHAQHELGDITFVELPVEGEEVSQGDDLCVVESAKAAADVYSPVDGTIAAVNSALEEDPSLVNTDPYGDGWMFKIEINDTAGLDQLMKPEEYEQYMQKEAE